MMDLDRPAKVRRIRERIEHDRVGGALDLVGQERAPVFLLALETIRNATHGPEWTSWDEASILYDRFKDDLL